MITKIRRQSKKILRPIAKVLVDIHVKANYITIAGLIFSLFYFFEMMGKNVIIALLFLILSALMDAIDGEVARLSNSVSSLGSFLDSTLDRIEDTLYISAFIFINFPSFLVAITVGLSLVISYIRAKAEALGIKMEGRGIIERGERIVFILIILLLSVFSYEISLYVYYLFLLLTSITVVQRLYVVYTVLAK